MDLIQNSNLTFSASPSVSTTGKEVFLSISVTLTFLVENLLPPSTSYTDKMWTYNVSDITERKLKEK